MKITIVESIDEYHKDLDKELDKRIKSNKDYKPISGSVMTPKTFSKIFTPERIKLLRRIYKNHIKNIYQLAKELKKPYEVVHRNIKYFEGLGLIKIIRKGRNRVPCVESEFNISFFKPW